MVSQCLDDSNRLSRPTKLKKPLTPGLGKVPSGHIQLGDYLVTQELNALENALVFTEAYNPYWSRIGHSREDIGGL